MHRQITLRAGALLLTAMGLLANAAPAAAIVNGQLDGNDHPNVGFLVGVVKDPLGNLLGYKPVCSGTLISPTVFLSAAHCTGYLQYLGLEGAVTFDAAATGGSTFHTGTLYTNPYFGKSQSDAADLGVLVLDDPVTDVAPARLPTANLLDQMSANKTLDDQRYTAVGYGAIGWYKPYEPIQGGKVWYSDFQRRESSPAFKALNDTRVHLSQNPALGDSGTCYGDSGGPNFLGDSDLLVGITMTGDHVCRSTNITYRVDTPSARWFLNYFVDLP